MKRDIPTSHFPLVLPLLLSFTLALLSSTSFLSGEKDDREGRIEWSQIPSASDFPDAITPGSLRLACADTPENLEEAFSTEDLPFDSKLLRRQGSRVCHIWYRPTLTGFRAAPDDWSIESLFLDVQTAGFLTMREAEIGDALDMSKEILRTLPEEIEITLGLHLGQRPEWLEEALRFHYPTRYESISFRNNRGVMSASPWVQDYLKSGTVGEESRILVTRALFEGRQEGGELFHPLLDSFEDDQRFIRSQLAWEGGDLQFLQDPKNPSRLLLFYGDSARQYWGEELTEPEFAYVLKQEFGADEAIDMSGLAPHVDYAVSFLPRHKTALVSYPLRNQYKVARAAWQLLRSTYPHIREREIYEIDTILARGSSALDLQAERVDSLLRSLISRELPWSARVEEGLPERIVSYVAEYCPEDPARCLDLAEENPNFLRHRDFMGEWVSASLRQWGDQQLPDILLSIVASQLPTYATSPPRKWKEKVSQLEKLGLEVVRVPKIGGGGELGVQWAGISYTNSLYVEPTLYVPTFGLGAAEADLLRGVERQLPGTVKVVPIFAQHMQIFNGGLHCIVGVVRETAD